MTSGNLVTVAVFWSVEANEACQAGDLAKTSGTSTIGTIALAAEENVQYEGTGWIQACIYHFPVTGTGSLTVTYTGAAFAYYGIAIDEWSASSGWDSTASNRIEDSAIGATATDNNNSPTTADATSAAGALFLGVLSISNLGGTLTVTPDAAFTQSFEEQDDNTHAVGSVQYRIVTSGTTDAASWTTSNNRGWAAALAVFVENTPDGGASEPTISSPTPSGTLATQTTATLGATSDDSTGTFYGVVDDSAGIMSITASQIKLGNDSGDATAIASCNDTVSTTSPSCAITGLTANTAYSYAVVHTNTTGDSNVETGTFTTAAASQSPVPVILQQIAANDDEYDQSLVANAR